ncbi:hypothetical protein PF010_g25023 [Phytophthora fragariae]|uniref:Uncharacterized protein n=1 Tax=Phytophthora fragariae TaxID=53985 RepID=A0A6A3R1Z1_9STRA|nr:hypothetical protein PF003_g13621 [Phytophthora fragariae]KAE8923816.1 hypothetical protein PF009_g25938 [Phytophthora fragariae]KAE9073553.1 hypothetical protein PF010_g25023 [Phytophthora fragariae]KAE9087858.1 hypothetical protein PF006_g25710 [Phytophthora fragariae]
MACMALVAVLTIDLYYFCMLQRCRARVTEDGGGVRAVDRMLQFPSSKVRGCWGCAWRLWRC